MGAGIFLSVLLLAVSPVPTTVPELQLNEYKGFHVLIFSPTHGNLQLHLPQVTTPLNFVHHSLAFKHFYHNICTLEHV